MLMSSILETEPSNFEEANAKQVWRDPMSKEYKLYSRELCIGDSSKTFLVISD